jgi:superfamily II DNA or RNA helicase
VSEQRRALAKGDLVVHPGDSARSAVVVGGPERIGGGTFWLVRLDEDDETWFTEGELRKREVDRSSPAAWLTSRSLVDPANLARALTHLKLTSSLTDIVYSFNSTRTIFRVHQFKPVLKLVSSDNHRLLLADEVGLGKTIEAGLAWAELDARNPMRRVLVVCPGTLCAKWQLEMHRRFDRDLDLVDRNGFLRFCDTYEERGDGARLYGVASYGSLRQDAVLEALARRPPTFDLVIVDEAHAMRNPSSKTAELGELLAQNSEALLLLSATPVNLGSDDLFNLLRLLRPDEFVDPAAFRRQIEPNGFINGAGRLLRAQPPPTRSEVLDVLRQVESTAEAARFRTDPVYSDLIRFLSAGEKFRPADVLRVQGDLTSLNTLSHVFTRTRKRDLRDHLVERRARTIPVQLTSNEQTLYEASVGLVSLLRQLSSGIGPGLSAVMPARQAASCLPAMTSYLEELRVTKRVTTDQTEGMEGEDDGEGTLVLDLTSGLDAPIGKLIEFAETLGAVDSKFDALLAGLRNHEEANSKPVLLFSFFRRTLAYLQRRLTESGFRCQTMTGATPMKDRARIQTEFRRGDFEILLCSEIGSEGLDFEFCQVVVNYDLPWNPMKLEQRIGRIDRFGQRSAVVFVWNFEIPGTIDTEIFLRLYRRIRIFEDSIGELEPILGSVVATLNRELASSELTSDEQERVALQFERAIERERQNLDRFDADRDRLLSADAYIEDSLEDARRHRRYVTAEEMERYVGGFVAAEGGTARLGKATDRGLRRPLQGSSVLADLLRSYGPRAGIQGFNDMVGRLEAGGVLPVAFDPDAAAATDSEFLNLRHPIVRSIASYYGDHKDELHPAGYLRIPAPDRRSWIFFIFLFTASGVVPSRRLWAVAWDRATHDVDLDVGEEILAYLAGPDPVHMAEHSIPVLEPDEANQAYRQVLLAVQQERDRQKVELDKRNEALIAARRQSIEQTHRVRYDRISELAERAGLDERIRRMRNAQLANLESGRIAKLEELSTRAAVSVGFSIRAAGLADFG